MRPLLAILALFFSIALNAQVIAFYNACVFNSPADGPYVELAVTISGKSLASKPAGGGGRQCSAHTELLIYRDTTIVKAAKYNVIGPVFSGTDAPSFIDQQRVALPAGDYKVVMKLSDNLNAAAKPLEIHDHIAVEFAAGEIQSSSVLAMESYSRANAPGRLTHSGFDMVPYNAEEYPQSKSDLSFYVEIYNADKVLGSAEPFVFTWHLEDRFGKTVDNFAGFRKQNAAPVNPLLASMDIDRLPSGQYKLVLETRDKSNSIAHTVFYRFIRVNPKADAKRKDELAENRRISEYFGSCSNADTLQMFVECLWPIAGNFDKERIINQSVNKDPDMMRRFVVDFWERRAADTGNALAMWASYYKQVQQVMKLFRCGKQKGYYTERGRVYLQYGPPNQRSMQPMEPNTWPYEIWQYYQLTDGVTGQIYTNRKFVFVNHNLGDDCHVLVHSDMRGEINNPRWQYEVMRRNMQGIGNPDQVAPAGAENTQLKDIYTNPR